MWALQAAQTLTAITGSSPSWTVGPGRHIFTGTFQGRAYTMTVENETNRVECVAGTAQDRDMLVAWVTGVLNSQVAA